MFKTPGVSMEAQSSIPGLAKVKFVAVYNAILIPPLFLFSLTFDSVFLSTTFKFVLLLAFKYFLPFHIVSMVLSNTLTIYRFTLLDGLASLLGMSSFPKTDENCLKIHPFWESGASPSLFGQQEFRNQFKF